MEEIVFVLPEKFWTVGTSVLRENCSLMETVTTNSIARDSITTRKTVKASKDKHQTMGQRYNSNVQQIVKSLQIPSSEQVPSSTSEAPNEKSVTTEVPKTTPV